MSAATRKLRVRKYTVKDVNYEHFSAFRVRLEVVEAVGMSPQVFVFRRSPPDPVTGEQLDAFMCPASLVDLSEYPADSPDPAAQFPLFRKDSLELDFRTVALAEETVSLILDELRTLVHSLNLYERLTDDGDVTIGPFPEDGGDQGGSFSDSLSFS